jgi:ArsR family transcriptional regulator, virulence genes transcriptional regulator
MKTDIVNGDFSALESKAEEASIVLGAMANAKRLMVLCNLLEGEKSVGQLADTVGLSPAALSQHLGKMRALRLVETRRDGQVIFYRLASDKVREILETLYRLYCAPEC